MPEFAATILDKFITTNDMRCDDPELRVTYDFTFLDDTYVVWKDQDKKETGRDAYNSDGFLKPNAVSYCANRFGGMSNHPLQVMARFKREDLFTHELVRALLFRKWRYMGNIAYVVIMLIQILFLVMLSSFMFSTISPYRLIQELAHSDSKEMFSKIRHM
ncbi:hypothetical protein Ciccas_005618 [Cichlidogyrus casuarinus]|uniref:Uncharacterized protein n=1 Tax=Cichlidogyrus casuarinus TaxID=1844966 RepID=A0ABD2Q853_9PLAT